MTEQELVKRCLEDICRKNGLGDVSAMTQRNFELISQEVEQSTGILISISTIRRLLNGEFSRMPQTATLNAISGYLGFKNWQAYKASLQHTGAAKEEQPVTPATPLNPDKYKSRFPISRKWLGIAAVVLGIMLFFGFVHFSSRPPHNYDKATFSASKITSNDVPNTVVFNYNVDDVNADSFFIQQSWDRNRRVKIDKKQHTLTDIYYEPGYHVAKLIANDSIIKTVDVSIPTDKWIFYAKDRQTDNSPKFISTSGIKNGSLQISKEEAVKGLVNIEKENAFIMAWLPSKFETSSDNFILKCRVKVNEVKNNVCPYLMYEVFCQKYFMYCKSKPMGCSNEIMAQFGDNALNGKTTNLSALAMDVKSWQDIELVVQNRKVSIRINGVDVYSTQYRESAGLITGLGFISNELSEVDYVSLKGVDGKVVYENDFNK